MGDYDLLKNITMLCVDDDDDIRDLLFKALGRRVKNITIATDGKDGLEKFEKQEFDIIVSDIRMPRMDGLEMVKKIREISADIPVIFSTAHNEKSYLERARELNAAEYFLKPVMVKDLLDAILKHTNMNEQ